MTITPYLFLNLWTAKDVVRKMTKECYSRATFGRQHAEWSQKLLRCRRHHFYHVLITLSWKMSFLVISKILALFFNILNAHQKYTLCNTENLQQSI